MEDMMKELFDDLVLDETKKSEIRKSIISTKTQKYTGVKIAITSLAAILLVLFSVPFTRNAIVSAATKCIKVFIFSNGETLTVGSEPDETYVALDNTNENLNSTYINGLEYTENEYVNTENGRVIFTYEDITLDITEQCSNSTYYRFETTDNNGYRIIICVGGESDNIGWLKLIFSPDGEYLFNESKIDHERPCECRWHDLAAFNEGVPCGNPEFDSLLEK